MPTNEIIAEIHRMRAKISTECEHDPKRIGARMRTRQKEQAAQGVRYVSFASDSAVVREEPPKR